MSVDDSQKIVKRPRQSLESKRRISEVVAAIENTETKPPDNMYEVLQDVFQIFWELDIEPEVSAPFFSLITQHNCGPTFGMPDFFDRITESCTLANIKVDIMMYNLNNTITYIFILGQIRNAQVLFSERI